MLFTDISSDRAITAFKKANFWVLGGSKHIIMTNGARKIVIPRHTRLNPYTLKSIIRDAGLTNEEFKENL
ncbi:type II toxin-antitoxin system HicA family toxin [Candidatus Azambacteria bacterium]|nr:type II toxin-antitoxin system HicA family toxin [Candidatus Azambacteria bacterium]